MSKVNAIVAKQLLSQEKNTNHGSNSIALQKTTLMQKKKKSNEQMLAKKSKSNKTGLPDDLKNGMEKTTGVKLDDVKVHKNSSNPAKVGAHAYAQGKDIHLGSGQEKHLPHELGHTVPKAKGKVKANTSTNGQAVNDDPSLEKGADVLGAKALQKSAKDTVQKKNDAKEVQEAIEVLKNKEKNKMPFMGSNS